MRLAIVGTNGRTGAHVLTQALERGWRVNALVRDASRLPESATRSDAVTVQPIDLLNAQAVITALAGCDAVISAVGVGRSRGATTLYSVGTANLIVGMREQRVPRLAVISAAPAGSRAAESFLNRRLLMPVLDRFFGGSYDDMRRMETQLRATDLDWVSVRPPRLVPGPIRGSYRFGVERPVRGSSISFADLATALLDGVGRDDWQRHCVYVSAGDSASSSRVK